MNERISARIALAGAVVVVLVSVITGWLFFSLGPRQHTSEYPFLWLWSLPPAAFVYVAARRVPQRIRRLHPAALSVLLALIGIALALLWTVAAYLLSGGYLLAADFPVLWCWVFGCVAGMLATVAPRSAAQWSYSALTFVLVIGAGA